MSTNTALDQIKNRVEGHTEGPWEVREGCPPYEPGVWAQGETTNPIGRCADCGTEGLYEVADAELIAAAPRLLAALEAVQALADQAMSESSYLLPGGYPSKPVEACLIHTAIEEALR